LNLLYKLVRSHIPYPLGAFENARSFLSISNLSFIIERILKDSTIAGGIYNLSDDLPLSTNEVIGIISTGIGQRTKLWNLNRRFVEIAARVGDMLHLPLNTETLKKLTESYVVSNDKIKAALGIKGLPCSSRAGLLRTIESFQTK
jgi:nucleoside-diphosphate-sugar epimerase